MEAKSSSEGSMTKDDVDVMVDIGYGRDRPASQLSGAVGYSGAMAVLNKKGQEKLKDLAVSGLNHPRSHESFRVGLKIKNNFSIFD